MLAIMKKSEQEVRNTFIKMRVNEDELKLIKKKQQLTTEKSLSNYLRKIALHDPVTVRYRNESADEFLRQMLELKKELNGIGNNFNQAVHKLHLLDKIPEFRDWLRQYDSAQAVLNTKVSEIRLLMSQCYEQWLQK